MKSLWTHLAFVLVIGAMVNTPSAQSLADLARREEARRKSIKAPAKVITNDDLPSVPPPPSSPSSPEAAPAADTLSASTPAATTSSSAAPPSGATTTPALANAPAATPATPAKDENYWRQRMNTARDALGRLQTFQDALQSRINALSTDFVNRDDPAQRAVIGSDRQKALAELDRVKREIQQTQTEITDAQEEARKAGVPPGWVR
jgi:hypothetical protein